MVFSNYQIPQVLYVFGIITENADRISPWQCPNPWSWSWVCPSIGLTPSVVCFWNCHRKCWWNKTLAMPIFISMVMVMSIFECFRSYWSWFLGLKGLLRLVEVWKKVVQRSIWMLLLLVMSEWPKGQNSLKPCLAKCLWNRHRKCWWNKTLAMPISISMVMVTSIFECFRSCWSWFLGPKGLLRLVEVRKKVVHRSIWMSLLLVKMSEWPEGPKFFNPFLAKLGRFKAILKDHTNSTKSSMINFWNHP